MMLNVTCRNQNGLNDQSTQNKRNDLLPFAPKLITKQWQVNRCNIIDEISIKHKASLHNLAKSFATIYNPCIINIIILQITFGT